MSEGAEIWPVVVGALLSGGTGAVVARLTVEWTTRRTAQNAAQDRVEAAVGELIVLIPELYTAGLGEKVPERVLQAWDRARIRVRMLTAGSLAWAGDVRDSPPAHLDALLSDVARRWPWGWRQLEFILNRYEPDPWLTSAREDLEWILLDLRDRQPETCTRVARRLKEWKADMDRQLDGIAQWQWAAYYAHIGVQPHWEDPRYQEDPGGE